MARKGKDDEGVADGAGVGEASAVEAVAGAAAGAGVEADGASAVADGDADAAVTAFDLDIDRLYEGDFEFDPGERTLAGDMRDYLLDEVIRREMGDVWTKLEADAQQRVIDRVTHAAFTMVRCAFALIGAADFPVIEARLVKVLVDLDPDKGGLTVTLKSGEVDDGHVLLEARNTPVTVVLARAEDFMQTRGMRRPDPVQRDMFEPGASPADLAAAVGADPETGELPEEPDGA